MCKVWCICRCNCLKSPEITLTILSVVFWGVAAGLIYMGAWMYKEYQHFDQLVEAKYTLIPATIIIASGVFLFFLGVIGCVGACKQQKCALVLFSGLSFLIFAGLVTGSVLASVYRGQVAEMVQDGIQTGLDNYGTDGHSVITDEVDFMQSQLLCCGRHNYTDWQKTTWYHEQKNKTVMYPSSCCKDNKCDYNSTHPWLYEDGCYDKLRDQFLGHLGLIIGVGVAFTIVLTLGMVCSCVMVCSRTSGYESI